MQDVGFQPKTNGANFNVNIHLRGQPRLTPAKKLRPLGFSRKVKLAFGLRFARGFFIGGSFWVP